MVFTAPPRFGQRDIVGWVKRERNVSFAESTAMGFTSFNPSYGLAARGGMRYIKEGCEREDAGE